MKKGMIGLHTNYTTDEEIEEMRKAIRLEMKRQSDSGLRAKNKLRMLIKTAGQILFFLIVILLSYSVVSAGLARSRGEVPDILGFNLFVVESGSMEPTFNIGAVIICRRPGNPEKLKVNDIVTFKNLSGDIVTHRIVEVVRDDAGNTAYRTKGDNPRNSVDPELLTPDRVISVFVAKIPLT
jgi:signal peptidase